MSDDDNTRRRVENYLKDSGFPLETHVAGLAQKLKRQAGRRGSVEQRVIYETKNQSDEKILRETDLTVGWMQPLHVDDLHFSLKFVIECKSSNAQPWVLFRASSTQAGRQESIGDAWLNWYARGKTLGKFKYEYSLLAGLDTNRLLDTRITSCSGIESTNDPNKSGATKNYAKEAVRQALTAARSLTRADTVYWFSRRDVLGITVPVVVTSAPLYFVEVQETGDYSIETTHRELLVSRFEADEPVVPVWVVDDSTGVTEVLKELWELQPHVRYQT